jgi:pilus assembly protein Flp/PilA
MDRIRRLWRDDEGVSAIEYGLIAGLVAVVIIGALALTGSSLQSVFETIAGELQAVAGESGADGGASGT